MAKILQVHDNDKEYIFTCPICGTVFVAKERELKNEEDAKNAVSYEQWKNHKI